MLAVQEHFQLLHLVSESSYSCICRHRCQLHLLPECCVLCYRDFPAVKSRSSTSLAFLRSTSFAMLTQGFNFRLGCCTATISSTAL